MGGTRCASRFLLTLIVFEGGGYRPRTGRFRHQRVVHFPVTTRHRQLERVVCSSRALCTRVLVRSSNDEYDSLPRPATGRLTSLPATRMLCACGLRFVRLLGKRGHFDRDLLVRQLCCLARFDVLSWHVVFSPLAPFTGAASG